jgi:hypothetical protein
MSVKPRRVFAVPLVVTVAGTVAGSLGAVAADPAPPQAPHTARSWKIAKAKVGCTATEQKKGAAAKPYTCPDDEDVRLPLVLVQPAESTECFVERNCGMCNPPPPTQKLRCPG